MTCCMVVQAMTFSRVTPVMMSCLVRVETIVCAGAQVQTPSMAVQGLTVFNMSAPASWQVTLSLVQTCCGTARTKPCWQGQTPPPLTVSSFWGLAIMIFPLRLPSITSIASTWSLVLPTRHRATTPSSSPLLWPLQPMATGTAPSAISTWWHTRTTVR